MFENSETTINEMTAGDGSGLALPPSFVFVKTKKRRVYKKNDDVRIDGRKKNARKLVKRILNNRTKRQGKMEEAINGVISEAEQSATEKAQKQIKQQKVLKGRQELQKKRQDAKGKMQDKSQEMETLVKARLSDFRKKSAEKQQKATKVVQKNSFDPTGQIISEDVFSQAFKIAQEGRAYGNNPEISFASVTFLDGAAAQISYFDAQKIVAAYEGLNDENRVKFCALLNMNANTYANALQFAQYNM
jgi:hypothetical protein